MWRFTLQLLPTYMCSAHAQQLSAVWTLQINRVSVVELYIWRRSRFNGILYYTISILYIFYKRWLLTQWRLGDLMLCKKRRTCLQSVRNANLCTNVYDQLYNNVMCQQFFYRRDVQSLPITHERLVEIFRTIGLKKNP